MQKKQKIKPENQKLKTTSKYRSAARAVRPSSSTRGLLPLYFLVVFLCFLFKGGEKRGCMNVYGSIIIIIIIIIILKNDLYFFA
jgi:uncharacterized membrane protein